MNATRALANLHVARQRLIQIRDGPPDSEKQAFALEELQPAIDDLVERTETAIHEAALFVDTVTVERDHA